ncbi:anti-sigma factor [Aequorivita echinoideorum]|uniref:Anti-sigma factor n=1 Tax=Aequorivita echinoideorum TaxID=1549647 RepID=A0ABS5S5C2_9FLAO|nr:anti-sigma factor [Aequorivita echinoideorum]MBT0608421.1 anti-sigma factor [Aequorivita echinoideorum]
MTAAELIESGKLEMYLCGALPAEEIAEVEEAIETYPEVKKETERIEESLIELAEKVAPTLSAMVWSYILNSINKVKTLGDSESKSTNWGAITGWAAAILCIGGIMWMLNQNNNLNKSVELTNIENSELKENLNEAETSLAANEEVLEILRSREYQTFTLPGNQAVAPDAFAKVYLNNNDGIAYIDVKGLPEAPRGKVYQVWSLVMEPLTPSSMGLVEAQNEVASGIYKFTDFPKAEAFGITLEPEGGSETPTLTQLYILGQVKTL